MGGLVRGMLVCMELDEAIRARALTTRSGVQTSFSATRRTPQCAYVKSCYLILSFLIIPLSFICSSLIVEGYAPIRHPRGTMASHPDLP